MKITICSSAIFAKQSYEVKKKLEEIGHTVFIYPTEIKLAGGKTVSVEKYYEMRKENFTGDLAKVKEQLIKDHIKRIEDSNAILVLNFEKNGKKGYIGGNTFLEMAIAYYLGKKIFLWEEPGKDLPYLEEILPLNPIIINGSLGMIGNSGEAGPRIILASKSPRRKILLENLGIDFEVMESNIDEFAIRDRDPFVLTKKLASAKAESVAKAAGENVIVIGADTVVLYNGQIIEKPKDEEDARRILNMLSGNTHKAITSICVINTKTGKIVSDSAETDVTFRKLIDREIESFIESKEPLDGAGGYTHKMHALIFEKIDGSHTNVIGLPMEKLIPALRGMGVDV